MNTLVNFSDNGAVFGTQSFKNFPAVRKAGPIKCSTFELREDLNSAAQDVRLHKQGKLKLKTAQDLLSEL